MKKMLPIFLILTFPFLLFSKTKNTLVSSAGTMSLVAQTYCDGEVAFPSHNNDESLDAGDLLKFVIHDNAGASLGNMFGGQGDASTAYGVFPGMSTGTIYYISAIAGMDDGTGKIDLNDPDLSVSQGTPVTFIAPMVTNFQEAICEGDFLDFNGLICTTPGPYQVVVTASNGCDSVLNLDLIVLNPIAAILPANDIDCGANVNVTLQAVILDPSPNVFYDWSGPCLINNGSPNVQVFCGGNYQLIVSKIELGVVCFSDPVVITVNENTAIPIADAGPSQEINCDSPSVVIGGGATSMGPQFVYSWTSPQGGPLNNTPFIQVSAPGLYCLSVINTVNSCQSNTECVSVFANVDPPDSDAGPDQVIDCTNPTVILGGAGTLQGANISYEWTLDGISVGNSLNYQTSVAGTYCLTVTNQANGCTDTSCADVSVDGTVPSVTATSSGAITCINNQIDIITQVSNCNNCSYIWSDNSQNPNLTAFVAGTYTVTITDTGTGCTSFASATVSANANPPTAVVFTSGEINCVSSCVTLDGSGSFGGGNLAFDWSLNGVPIPDQNPVVNVCTPGVYELIVTNQNNGCSALSTVVVTINTDLPIVDAGPDQVIGCTNTSVTLDGSASSSSGLIVYEWMDDTGAFISTNETVTVVTPGTYTLVVTDADNGCSAFDEVIVTVDGSFGTLDLGDDLIFDCITSEMIIQGVSIPTGTGFTYQWTTTDGVITSGSDTSIPTISSAGTYSLEINDIPNGCFGSDQITIFDIEDVYDVNPNMNLNCNMSIPNELDATLIFPNLNLSFAWSTADGQIISGANTLNPIVGSVGTYTLTVTDNFSGCSSMTSMVMGDLILPTAIIDAPDGLVIDCNNGGVVLDAGNSIVNPPSTFLWTANGNGIGTDIVLTVTTAGTYELLVTDAEGCQDVTSVVVTENLILPNFSLINTVILDCANNFSLEVGPELTNPNPNDFSYEWSGTNNFSSSDSSVVFTQDMEGGLYEVTITNTANGCTDIGGPIQVAVNGFDFDITTTVAGCDLQDGTATATTGLANSLVEWSTGEQGNTISNLAQGWYSVTLTDTDNDCSLHENFYVDEDISCKVVIGGYVVEDPNNTCTYDAAMLGVPCVMVKLEPLGIYTMTDSTGYYEFVVDAGTYTVEYIGSPEVDLNCPTPGTYNLVLDTDGSVSDGNHFYVLRPDFDLCISKNIGNARPGLNQFNCVQICNYGDDIQDGVVTFVHDPIFAEVTPLPNILPINGNAAGYTYDEATHTFTWNLQNMAPGECRKIMWYMTVPVTAQVGEIIYTEAKVNPIVGDENPANNCLAWNLSITGSYDPNDKRNFVGETQWGGAIYEDDMTMEYAIRFQNVGNDTAFTVVVRDTLDAAHLNVESIRGFVASHDMQVEFEESNILIFRFENINLVDSFTNEPGSNGWLSFDIDRLPGQDFGTEIKNQAAIYFDFNDPVITNEVVNTLTEPVRVFYPNKNKIEVQVIPNITDGNVLLQYVLEKPSPVSVQLHNAKGQLMQDFDFGKKQTGQHSENLDLKDYPAGVYFIFIKTEKGSAIERVVKY